MVRYAKRSRSEEARRARWSRLIRFPQARKVILGSSRFTGCRCKKKKKIAVAYCDHRKHFLLEEMTEVPEIKMIPEMAWRVLQAYHPGKQSFNQRLNVVKTVKIVFIV